MTRSRAIGLAATALVALAAATSDAQIARTRIPAGDGSAAPTGGGIPRDPQYPYAGLWRGTRTMPVGSDEVTVRFAVVDGAYSGAMLFPGGGSAPHRQLVATSGGLTWESPNSGGGTWVYHVRLVAADSMTGTLVLRDPPPNLTPAPAGTMVLVRQAPAGRREP